MPSNAKIVSDPDHEVDSWIRIWNMETKKAFKSTCAAIKIARTDCCGTEFRLGQPFYHQSFSEKNGKKAVIHLNRAKGFELELAYGKWELIQSGIVQAARETGRRVALEVDREMVRLLDAVTDSARKGPLGTRIKMALDRLNLNAVPPFGRWMLLPKEGEATGCFFGENDVENKGFHNPPPISVKSCQNTGAWVGHPSAMAFGWGFSPTRLILSMEQRTVNIMGQMVYGLFLTKPRAVVRI